MKFRIVPLFLLLAVICSCENESLRSQSKVGEVDFQRDEVLSIPSSNARRVMSWSQARVILTRSKISPIPRRASARLLNSRSFARACRSGSPILA